TARLVLPSSLLRIMVTSYASCDHLHRFLGCDYLVYFKINEVAPICDPLIEQRTVMSFHHLIAALEFLIHPTRHVHQALRRHATSVPKSPIRGDGILVLEMFHHHI